MEYMESQMQNLMEAGQARMEAFYDDANASGITIKEVACPDSFKTMIILRRGDRIVFEGDVEDAELYLHNLVTLTLHEQGYQSRLRNENRVAAFKRDYPDDYPGRAADALAFFLGHLDAHYDLAAEMS